MGSKGGIQSEREREHGMRHELCIWNIIMTEYDPEYGLFRVFCILIPIYIFSFYPTFSFCLTTLGN